jgi:hypothetical protein
MRPRVSFLWERVGLLDFCYSQHVQMMFLFCSQHVSQLPKYVPIDPHFISYPFT